MKRNFNEKSSSRNSIEKQIESIFMGLVSNLPKKFVAFRSSPTKGSSLCKGIIRIYLKEEIEKAAENERKYCRPIESYAFYVKDFQGSELESVAVYGDDVCSKYYILKRKGHLFGYKIATLKIESGLRPFLDAKLVVNH